MSRTTSDFGNPFPNSIPPSDVLGSSSSDATRSDMPLSGTDNNNDGVITQLNSLLRGAISATETYRIALDKVSDGQHAQFVGQLREMQEEHGRAAQAIRDRVRELGGEPSDSSGPWGVWAKTVTSVGSLFGDASALKALKEGEEHGLKDYQEAIDDVDSESADLIRNQLIPSQQRHIRALDGMINGLM